MGNPTEISGTGDGAVASLICPGGMTRLGHPFDENMSIFPFDPAIHIKNLYTVANDFFKVEDSDTGAHAGTHIDVPAHFIEGGDALDDLAAESFVWPVVKIDVRGIFALLDDGIAGVGTDAYGPDASSNADFLAGGQPAEAGRG